MEHCICITVLSKEARKDAHKSQVVDCCERDSLTLLQQWRIQILCERTDVSSVCIYYKPSTVLLLFVLENENALEDPQD